MGYAAFVPLCKDISFFYHRADSTSTKLFEQKCKLENNNVAAFLVSVEILYLKLDNNKL